MMKTIGRYQIQSELGQGGMAQVFLAYDPNFRRQVALKLVAPAIRDNPVLRARFEREARLIAAIEHPAITPVYDFGEADGQLFLVMRFMPGGSAADLLKQGPLDPARTLLILGQVAPALDAVHAQGIVHRDLKPANILLDRFGNAAIADFGIAYITEATSELTGEAIIGTPHYMSPEQVQGERNLDGRSDVYALGVIAFQMLAGQQPYQSTTPLGVVLKHISQPVPSIYTYRADLPDGLEAVFEKAMAKDREVRYPTAGAFVAALRTVLEANRPRPEAQARRSLREAETEVEIEPPASSLPGEDRLALPQIRQSTPAPSLPGEARLALPQIRQSTPDLGEGGAPPSPVSGEGGRGDGGLQPHPLPPPHLRGEGSAPPSPVSGEGGRGDGGRPTQVTPTGEIRRSAAAAPAPQRKGARLALAGGAVGVLGVCGILLLVAVIGGFNLLGRGASQQATATAQALGPTQAPGPVTPTGQTGPAPARLLAQEDFSDPGSGWPVGEERYGVFGYREGRYLLQVLELDTLMWAGPDTVYDDVRITVEAAWNSDEQSGYYGVYCRLEDEFNYYYFVMLASGREYSIGKYVDGSFTSLLPGRWNASEAVPAGRATSTLEVVCSGDTLRFSINGILLNEVNDIVFSSGQTGVVAAALTEQAEVLFDNFRVESAAP